MRATIDGWRLAPIVESGVVNSGAKRIAKVPRLPVWNGNPYCEPGSVLYYPGYPGTGATIRDFSGQGNHGTIVGATWKKNAQGLWYIEHDGSASYIDTGATFQSTFRGSFTLKIWVRLDDGQSGLQFLLGSLNAAGQDKVSFYINATGNLLATYAANNNSIATETNSSIFSNGQETWHQCIAVYDSTVGGVGGIVLYFDGALQALDAVNNGDTSGITFDDFRIVDNLYIGARNNNGVADLDALTGDTALWQIVEGAWTAEQCINSFNRVKHLLGVS